MKSHYVTLVFTVLIAAGAFLASASLTPVFAQEDFYGIGGGDMSSDYYGIGGGDLPYGYDYYGVGGGYLDNYNGDYYGIGGGDLAYYDDYYYGIGGGDTAYYGSCYDCYGGVSYDDCYYSDCYGYDYDDDSCYGCYGYTDYYYPSVGYASGGYASYGSGYSLGYSPSGVGYSSYPVGYPTGGTPRVSTSIVPVGTPAPISVASGRPTNPVSAPVSYTYSNNGNTYIDNSVTDNSIINSFNTGTNISSPGATAVGATTMTIVPIATAQPIAQASYTYQQPSCTITLSNYGSISGQATLTWNAYNATSASISGIGSVSTYGSRTVYPSSGQSFTMTVSGQGGSAICTTSAYYKPVLAPTYTTPTYTPTSQYVSLSQIPYTGFDLGPVGNALYWFGMIGFAMAGAYLLVYYRGGVFAFVAAQKSLRQSERPSPIKVMLPVAPAVVQEAKLDEAAIRAAAADRTVTSDYMSVVARAGEMPRIVIQRA